jgi:hypothetical protein
MDRAAHDAITLAAIAAGEKRTAKICPDRQHAKDDRTMSAPARDRQLPGSRIAGTFFSRPCPRPAPLVLLYQAPT